MDAVVLLPCTRPFLRPDGQEHPLARGEGRPQVEAPPGADLDVLTRNGPLNHQPLRPRLLLRRP